MLGRPALIVLIVEGPVKQDILNLEHLWVWQDQHNIALYFFGFVMARYSHKSHL